MIPARGEILGELARIGTQADEEINLGEAALLLAFMEIPKTSLENYRNHIQLLIDETRAAMARKGEDTLLARAEVLHEVLVENHHYRGDSLTYDDLQNANLIRVIDRRMGLPITLGVLYLAVCLGLGWDAEGLNFPGHFLVRLNRENERIIIDPFHDGQEMDVPRLRHMLKAAAGIAAELTPDHYLPMARRDILLRLQNNIKLRLVQQGRLELALKTVEVMQAIAPKEISLWRDRGMLLAAQGEIQAAIETIQKF
ncbi:MAG TPA: transglutaminase-like domain-containing protein, partial [Alphaproteobacteria bacterium]|nr:transglutaminase-like domain-containing protein [Alphaproteobacteria bacterium]